jgi:cytosine/adenosine deaminase-related metal-dependent hydrolase
VTGVDLPDGWAADDPGRRVLIRGGRILSMDPQIGDLVGDVLIEGETIVAVGPDLGGEADVAIEVDVGGYLVLPGFVDSHLHAWQGQIAGIAPDISLPEYEALIHGRLAPQYRPEDMRIGNLLSALRCLESGVTCMVDNSHNSRSEEHCEAAIEGLRLAGIRAVHAVGAPIDGSWEGEWRVDMERLRSRDFASEDQLLTLGMFTAKPEGQRQAWEYAKRHGYRVSTEIGFWSEAFVIEAAAAGLVDDRHAFNHCSGLSPEAWKVIADHGVNVNVCGRSDTSYLVGPATPPVAEALAHRVPTGISMDTEVGYGIDAFAEMSTILYLARGRASRAAFDGVDDPPPAIGARDLVEMATRGGAANAGLGDRIGSLTPGKQADVVVIKPPRLGLGPAGDAAAEIVSFARSADVDAVIVAGRPRKWGGELLGHDLEAVRATGGASRRRLLTAAGVAIPTSTS